MTTEQMGLVEKIFFHVIEGDKPFMALFLIIMCFMIYMAMKAMTYVKGISESHKEQMASMNQNMADQRKDHYQQLSEDRMRSNKREDELFSNMSKNTEKLGDIALTLKEVQFNFANLENKVTDNFDFLSSEIENVKTHVTVKTTVTSREVTSHE